MKIVITKSLTRLETEKTQRNLEFISLFTQVAKDFGMRAIVHGGYSVDGALGKITKPHKDVDIQVYGNQSDAESTLSNIFKLIKSEKFDYENIKWKDKGRSTFYHNFLAIKGTFCADFYYIQVTGNPFDKNKIIIKDDGKENEIQEYRTHKVTLTGVSFEATLPEDELDDKKSKNEKEGKLRADIDQDILNLESLLQK